MSVPLADLPSVTVQKSAISSSLNSTIVFTFMIGIYTIVFFNTLYLYLTKRDSKQRIIISTITALYSLSIVQWGFQLWDLQWTFLQHGETRENIFLSMFISPGWGEILSTTSTVLTLVLADGLLIWRCFFVWDQSLRAILFPVMLFFVEIALSITSIIIISIDLQNVTPKISAIFSSLESSLYFVSVATSLTATGLIAFRINSVSNIEGVSTDRFKHIIEIVLQSAMIYSVALLVPAIGNVVPRSIAFENYSAAICSPITGLAPTVMVARVCKAADNSTNLFTHHLSGLQFQGQSSSDIEAQVEINNLRETADDVVLSPQENKTSTIILAKNQ